MSEILPRLTWRGWLATVSGVAAVALIAIQIQGRLSTPPVSPPKPLVVDVYEVAPRNIEISRRYNATIRDNDRAVITARVAAPVSDLLVREGERVEAGAIIAELDKQETRAELDRVKAQVQQIQADVRFFQRQTAIDEKLYSEGAISEATLDDSKRKLEGLQAALSQQKNNLLIAEQKLAYSTVLAPIDGVLQRLYLSRGEQAMVGSPVAEIVGTANYKAIIAVPEKDMPEIRRHAAVTIQHLNGASFHGRIDRIYPALDDRTHTGTIEIYLTTDSAGQLFPGSIAKAEIVLQERNGVLAVPAHAVTSRRGVKGVYVEINGKAQWREVNTGESTGRDTIIESGIKAGEKVIATPYPTLKEGTPVVPVKASQ